MENLQKLLSISDLSLLRTAPKLSDEEKISLVNELNQHVKNVDWFTVGIMANSTEAAINCLRNIENYFGWEKMRLADRPSIDGPVYLKANQRSGDVYIRIEYGLGEGFLLSSQFEDNQINTETSGPFPLDFLS